MKPSVEVQGLQQVVTRIQSLPDEGRREVMSEVGKYGIEVLRKEEPRPKRVTRRAAYGQSFFTDRQRRWFFWALKKGELNTPYHRTGHLAASWQVKTSPADAVFSNIAPYAPVVIGFAFQSRHEKMVGWKTVTQLLSGPLSFLSSRFRLVVDNAYQAAIRRLDLG